MMGKPLRTIFLALMLVMIGLILFQSHSQLDFTWNQRYVTKCTGCNKFGDTPIIEPEEVCKQHGGNTTSGHPVLIFLVMSPSIDKVSRDAVRDTWGDIREQRRGHFRVVFVVGRMRSTDLLDEASRQGDILQLNVPDTQKAMTEKVTHSFRWFTLRCPSVEYVMKTNIEVFINVPYIFRILKRYELKNTIAGHCYHRFENPDRVRNKWYNTLKEVSGSHSPPYCSGSGYLMRRDTVAKLASIFGDTPYIPIDDVYLGFCAYKTNVEIWDVPGFHVDYVGYDAFQYCHCVGTLPKVDAGRQREIYVQQLTDCKQSWARGTDDLRTCYVDFNDVVMPVTIMVLSGCLISVFLIVRRRLH